MEINEIGTHKTHCCILHGCIYGNLDCPVENKLITQVYICEECYEMGIKDIQTLTDYLNNNKKTCPHCGHVLE